MVQNFSQLMTSLVSMRYQIVCDKNIGIHRVEKYFNQTGWYVALENFHKIEKSG